MTETTALGAALAAGAAEGVNVVDMRSRDVAHSINTDSFQPKITAGSKNYNFGHILDTYFQCYVAFPINIQ